MELPDREAEPQFSQPVSQIFSMLAVLAFTAAAGYVALPRVLPVFIANPWLNGFIVLVFVFGVMACFWQVFSLNASVRWIEGFVAQRPGHDMFQPPRLLAPLASLLRARGAHSQISTASTRSILDSVATRVDEAREITRYITSLLIFLGLLGTFYGLATSVPAIVETIRSLTPQGWTEKPFGSTPSPLESSLIVHLVKSGLRLLDNRFQLCHFLIALGSSLSIVVWELEVDTLLSIFNLGESIPFRHLQRNVWLYCNVFNALLDYIPNVRSCLLAIGTNRLHH